MSENIIDELSFDTNCKSSYNSTDYISSQCPPQDNDSTSSFLNLIDQDNLTNSQMMSDNYSPNYATSESTNHSTNDQPAKPDVKSNGLDQMFEDLLLPKLPQIVAIERASIQYQVVDLLYPSLSKSFQNCFNSPVLDLLVVVLDPNKLVTFYQGYFAGIPRLTKELINLTGKYWKSLISNNDENAWEHHFRSVNEKNNSKTNYEPEFEAGPVIRCRLRASSTPQFNQQFNYFFVQPCSYMIQLPINNFNSMDNNAEGLNNYLVSYINIVRECDTEYALKGSAAASLQKVITNSSFVQRQRMENILDTPPNKQLNNRNFRRNVTNSPAIISNQLSVNISSPAYSNIEQSTITASAPLTYPLINNSRSDQYTKTNLFTNAQIQHQHQISQQRQTSITMNHNQYMARGASLSTVDPNAHRYPTQYDNSHSSLQYILENRNNNYQNIKQIANPNHLMGHGQMYKNPIQTNHAYFLPAAQSAQQNCSLNSPTSFMPGRQVIQMPSNSILMSHDQYFRNGHAINLMDNVQVAQQPMLTVVQPMSAASNHSSGNYYYSTAQNQIVHNPIHINTSITNQSQFVSSSVSPYCNAERAPMSHQEYSNTSSRNNIQTPIKQENYDINICQNDWLNNSVLDSRNSTLMSGNSISIDIVEEILQAEEAKSENKSTDHDPSKSDSSDSLMGYLNDFMSINNNNNTVITTPTLPNKSTSPTLLNLNSVKSEGKISEFRSNSQPTNKSNNSQITNPVNHLKEEILNNLDSTQRLQIKEIVNQYKCGKIKKFQMYQQINHFLSQAFGNQTYSQQVIKFWNTHQQYPLNDSADSGFHYSHVVQSPEEGPGISPTEQAAQSTTDLEEDKELNKNNQKLSSSKLKDKSVNDTNKRLNRSKSTTKNNEASIYSITSTTSTGVLETLLNEHDNPMVCEKNINTINPTSIPSCKLPLSSTLKNQLSLDQLLMDDEYSIYPNNIDDKCTKKSTDSISYRTNNSKPNKSHPSTPLVNNNMGVLETLLNQKTPSMFTLRQMSTENILKHSKPSRQNSTDVFMDDSNNSIESVDKDKDKVLKKNSLLITLLNTSQNPEKVKMHNSSSSMDGSSPNFQSKRCRMLSGTQMSHDSNNSYRKSDDKIVSAGMDVFDFVENELSYSATDTQSTVVTSSQPLSVRKRAQSKRSRKRRYSKDRSVDSDESSDRMSSIGEKYVKTSSIKSEDKNVILTSLLENKKPRDNVVPSATSGKVLSNIEVTDSVEYSQPTMMYENHVVHDDNMDLEDIKIDDFDLENLIDISDNYDESNGVIMDIVDQPTNTTIHQSSTDPSLLANKLTLANTNMGSTTFDGVPPVYKMVGPIIKSDPIVPMSKQSILRVSDKNSILLSAIQSTSTSNSISPECLDSERERLLRQQQQQKLCMGGDKPPITMGHQLSLDMLSKQMKEVGPNVMVELSVPSDLPRSRKSSISRSQTSISTISTSCNPPSVMSTSPTCRSSYQTNNCSLDVTPEINKVVAPTSVYQVNHQQVREGLRLLVSSRSAQNSSKNMQVQRNSSVNLTELVPQSEICSTPKPAVKDVLHYQNIQSNQSHKDSSYPYSNQSYVSNIQSTTSEPKNADILEDSLVNDVFGLEELVNSKSRHSSSSIEYSRMNLQEPINGDSQMDTVPFSSQQNGPGSSMAQSKPPHHHHHYTHHYHHHHQHHHHHPISNPSSITDSSIPATKEKQNVNSGLLETLLSR